MTASPARPWSSRQTCFRTRDSVTVCLLTHVEVGATLLRLRLDPDPSNNLRQPSWVMVDKTTTFRRSNVGQAFGRVGPADLARLDRALALFLGIAS